MIDLHSKTNPCVFRQTPSSVEYRITHKNISKRRAVRRTQQKQRGKTFINDGLYCGKKTAERLTETVRPQYAVDPQNIEGKEGWAAIRVKTLAVSRLCRKAFIFTWYYLVIATTRLTICKTELFICHDCGFLYRRIVHPRLEADRPVPGPFQNENHGWPVPRQWAKPFVLQKRSSQSTANSETGLLILCRAARQLS